MKFLDRKYEGRQLIPLNIVSYEPFELGNRDAISITFKDVSTGKKYVEFIEKPKYEVYVLKPEYRASATFMANWAKMEKLDKHTISYRYRDLELSKILGCDPSEVRYSPLIFGYDVKIENFYMTQFLLEYGAAGTDVTVGFLDIENDVIQVEGFAQPGEAPMNAVTYIDGERKIAYTLVLLKDNLPHLPESNPKYKEIEEMRANFYRQTEEFVNDIDGVVKECHELFDESYPGFEYNIICFDEEIEMHRILWQIINRASNDFVFIWNAPYDMRNLIERPLALGYAPENLICDPQFEYKVCFFEEDDNYMVHKRSHKCIVSILPTIMDQMVLYAGIRSGRGRLPSVKLGKIAQIELHDDKLNYEEEGNIKVFPYKNFRKFVIYNLKDVLLQWGIHTTTGDIYNIVNRMQLHSMLISEVFTSTAMLTNSVGKYLLQHGFVAGTNANRILPPFDYKKFIANSEELSDAEYDALINPDDLEEVVIEDENADEDFYGMEGDSE